jgi:hypothetical protein
MGSRRALALALVLNVVVRPSGRAGKERLAYGHHEHERERRNKQQPDAATNGDA